MQTPTVTADAAAEAPASKVDAEPRAADATEPAAAGGDAAPAAETGGVWVHDGFLLQGEFANKFIRVGDEYQAVVPNVPHPRDCHERADELLWSHAACPLGEPELDAYVATALRALSGSSDAPTEARAHQFFLAELVYHRLQECRFDAEAALESLEEDPPALDEWSKAEERQFHAALGKKDRRLEEVAEMIKTKDLRAVVNYYYLHMGQRKKDERKKREIDRLKKRPSGVEEKPPPPPPPPPPAAQAVDLLVADEPALDL